MTSERSARALEALAPVFPHLWLSREEESAGDFVIVIRDPRRGRLRTAWTLNQALDALCEWGDVLQPAFTPHRLWFGGDVVLYEVHESGAFVRISATSGTSVVYENEMMLTEDARADYASHVIGGWSQEREAES